MLVHISKFVMGPDRLNLHFISCMLSGANLQHAQLVAACRLVEAKGVHLFRRTMSYYLEPNFVNYFV